MENEPMDNLDHCSKLLYSLLISLYPLLSQTLLFYSPPSNYFTHYSLLSTLYTLLSQAFATYIFHFLRLEGVEVGNWQKRGRDSCEVTIEYVYSLRDNSPFGQETFDNSYERRVKTQDSKLAVVGSVPANAGAVVPSHPRD